MRDAQNYIKNNKKTGKITLSWWGVGGYCLSNGGGYFHTHTPPLLKISLPGIQSTR